MNNDMEVVNYEEIKKAAGNLENAKTDIEKTIARFNNTVKHLGQTWQGEAAKRTQEAVDDFSKQYSRIFKKQLEEDIIFLKNDVLKGYNDTEDANSALAEAFKA